MNYKEIYLPSHPKAHASGCVYEHILVVEQKIGRYLTQEEVVHHVDENKKNNSPDNLIVFASQTDHSRFHKLKLNINDLILDGDHYITPIPESMVKNQMKNGRFSVEGFLKLYPEFEYLLNICPICGNKSINKFCSSKCANINRQKEYSLEELKKQLLKENSNFVSIGKYFGVSDNAIRKRCRKHGLPDTTQKLKQYKKENL